MTRLTCCLLLAVPIERVHLDEEELASHFEENSHDCIMSCLSMHWINDLPGASPFRSTQLRAQRRAAPAVLAGGRSCCASRIFC